MKKYILLLILVAFCTASHAQTKKDNYSFMKLMVTNDKGEILLLGNKDELEITGARYNDSLSVKEFVNWMGDRMGIKLKNIRLRGLVTFHFEGRSNPSLMHYYTAEYESGELILPKGCTEIKWVGLDKSAELIPYEEMNEIIRKIKECEYLFGGSYRIWKDPVTGKRESEVIEPFYRLN